jgi:glutamate/aspartate transport system permease protein
MFSDFDWGVIARSLPFLFLDGLKFSVLLTVAAAAGGVVLGTVLALLRFSRHAWLSGPAAAYVNVIRSIPLLLVIFWFFFLVPLLLQAITRSAQPVRIDPFWSSVITFSLFEAAYFCEIVRAGIGSIPHGQTHAALALGMTQSQVLRSIVLPQAFRSMVPLLLTQTIVLFQDTSLVYVLSITDFLGAASKVAQRDGRLVEMYLFAAVVYFVICLSLSTAVRSLERRIEIVR